MRSLRRELVFVDQAAEQVAPADAIEISHGGDRPLGARHLSGERRTLPERAVRPMLVEVRNVRDEHVVEVSTTDDQQPIDTDGVPRQRTGPFSMKKGRASSRW